MNENDKLDEKKLTKANEDFIDWKYQEDLTEKLDKLKPEELTKDIFYEIVLWKLNRFPVIDGTLINELKIVGTYKSREDAKDILKKMLNSKGIRLPMASTILRFLNPKLFAIIDERVFRVIYGSKDVNPDRPNYNKGSDENKIKIYFEYLEKLQQICDDNNIKFKDADRILYLYDKQDNKLENRY